MTITTTDTGLLPANPSRGRQRCPECGTSTWTMPWELPADGDDAGDWRCVRCHHDFLVVTAVVIDRPAVIATITGC